MNNYIFNTLLLNLLGSRYTKKITKILLYLFIRKQNNQLTIEKENIFQIYNDYNISFFNERSIEIPFSKHLIQNYSKEYKNPNILEVGNTLIHYENDSAKFQRTILDKYETHPEVINEDIKDYHPKKKFDIIFSISTLEHVGSDYEEIKEDKKFSESINHCLNLLNPNGVLIITLPIFYRSIVDKYIFNKERTFYKKYFFQRKNFRNDWVISSEKDTLKNQNKLKYNLKYPLANALFVGVIKLN